MLHKEYARREIRAIHASVKTAAAEHVSGQEKWTVMQQLSQNLLNVDLSNKQVVSYLEEALHSLSIETPPVTESSKGWPSKETVHPPPPNQRQGKRLPKKRGGKARTSSVSRVVDASLHGASAAAPSLQQAQDAKPCHTAQPAQPASATKAMPRQGSSDAEIPVPEFLIYNRLDAASELPEDSGLTSEAGKINGAFSTRDLQHSDAAAGDSAALQHSKVDRAEQQKMWAEADAADAAAERAAAAQAMRDRRARRKEVEEARKHQSQRQTNAESQGIGDQAAAEAKAQAAAEKLLKEEEKAAQMQQARKAAKRHKQAQRRARDQARAAEESTMQASNSADTPLSELPGLPAAQKGAKVINAGPQGHSASAACDTEASDSSNRLATAQTCQEPSIEACQGQLQVSDAAGLRAEQLLSSVSGNSAGVGPGLGCAGDVDVDKVRATDSSATGHASADSVAAETLRLRNGTFPSKVKQQSFAPQKDESLYGMPVGTRLVLFPVVHIACFN